MANPQRSGASNALCLGPPSSPSLKVWQLREQHLFRDLALLEVSLVFGQGELTSSVLLSKLNLNEYPYKLALVLVEGIISSSTAARGANS